MVLVRLAYVADLPAPGDLVKQLTARADTPGGTAPIAPRPPSAPRFGHSGEAAGSAAPRLAPEEAVGAPALPQPRSFLEVVELFDRQREAVLRAHLYAHVHLVNFEPGRIEFRPAEGAPRDLANRLGKLLGDWTGERWVVSVSQNEGEPTLREQAAARDETLRHEAAAHPLVRAVLDTFPGARIEAVRDIGRDAAVSPDPETLADEPGEGEP
jgi:DNA polymerase-3 subunit gamma/tau